MLMCQRLFSSKCRLCFWHTLTLWISFPSFTSITHLYVLTAFAPHAIPSAITTWHLFISFPSFMVLLSFLPWFSLWYDSMDKEHLDHFWTMNYKLNSILCPCSLCILPHLSLVGNKCFYTYWPFLALFLFFAPTLTLLLQHGHFIACILSTQELQVEQKL